MTQGFTSTLFPGPFFDDFEKFTPSMSMPARRFTAAILKWSDAHPREMPWKGTRDPYRIWISEIMLQQTQVAQGKQYYSRFLKRFPTVKALASASEDEVLRMWQGLGYNSRARNLHHAAKTIVNVYGGRFPQKYDDILALKGVGPYTAAAIASFAFGLPKPVLDSNVIRVLARVFGIDTEVTDLKTRKKMYDILEEMISSCDPAEFNQAIMNFGAIQCVPRNPDCPACPLAYRCVAFRDGLVDLLPVKPAKAPRRVRYFHYFLITDRDGVILRKRTGKDIWQNMYDLPVIESESDRKPVKKKVDDLFGGRGIRVIPEIRKSGSASQTLTHQQIHCCFYRISVRKLSRKQLSDACHYEVFENLDNFAFPKVIRTYLAEQSLLT